MNALALPLSHIITHCNASHMSKIFVIDHSNSNLHSTSFLCARHIALLSHTHALQPQLEKKSFLNLMKKYIYLIINSI